MTDFKPGDRFRVVQVLVGGQIRVGDVGTVLREKRGSYIRGQIDGYHTSEDDYYPFHPQEIVRIEPKPEPEPEQTFTSPLDTYMYYVGREMSALKHLAHVKELLDSLEKKSAESVLAEIKEYLEWKTE